MGEYSIMLGAHGWVPCRVPMRLVDPRDPRNPTLAHLGQTDPVAAYRFFQLTAAEVSDTGPAPATVPNTLGVEHHRQASTRRPDCCPPSVQGDPRSQATFT